MCFNPKVYHRVVFFFFFCPVPATVRFESFFQPSAEFSDVQKAISLRPKAKSKHDHNGKKKLVGLTGFSEKKMTARAFVRANIKWP